eukprot:5062765-Alexandrium_andersonii.AAC.1
MTLLGSGNGVGLRTAGPPRPPLSHARHSQWSMLQRRLIWQQRMWRPPLSAPRGKPAKSTGRRAWAMTALSGGASGLPLLRRPPRCLPRRRP